MVLEKLAALPFGDEPLGSAVGLGDRILAFTDKYEDQPHYNCGHRTLLAGGDFAIFEISTRKWTAPMEFPTLIGDSAERQRLDDLVFVWKDSAFLLAFDRFAGLSVHSLWRFEADHFEKVKQFDAIIHQPESSDQTFGSNVVAVESPAAESGDTFFVAKIFSPNGSGFGLFRIQLQPTVELKIVEPFVEIGSVTLAMDPLPFAAVRRDERIFVSIAERGCGYRWRTDDLLIYWIEGKAFSRVEIPSGKYRLLPMPSKSAFDIAANRWLFFGSPSAVASPHLGLRQSESKVLAVESLAEPFWSQSVATVEDARHDDVYVRAGGGIYVASPSKGICRLDLGEFVALSPIEED